MHTQYSLRTSRDHQYILEIKNERVDIALKYQLQLLLTSDQLLMSEVLLVLLTEGCTMIVNPEGIMWVLALPIQDGELIFKELVAYS